MTIVSIISLIFSFFLQGYTSTILKYSITNPSWFSTVYVLITLIILFPYYENKNKYLKLLIIFGLLTDIVYTNTVILNTIIFLSIYLICKQINFFLPQNILTVNILSIISIILYHIFNFLILTIIGFDTYTLKELLTIIAHSLIMTIIFGSIMYIIIDSFSKRNEVKLIK